MDYNEFRRRAGDVREIVDGIADAAKDNLKKKHKKIVLGVAVIFAMAILLMLAQAWR